MEAQGLGVETAARLPRGTAAAAELASSAEKDPSVVVLPPCDSPRKGSRSLLPSEKGDDEHEAWRHRDSASSLCTQASQGDVRKRRSSRRLSDEPLSLHSISSLSTIGSLDSHRLSALEAQASLLLAHIAETRDEKAAPCSSAKTAEAPPAARREEGEPDDQGAKRQDAPLDGREDRAAEQAGSPPSSSSSTVVSPHLDQNVVREWEKERGLAHAPAISIPPSALPLEEEEKTKQEGTQEHWESARASLSLSFTSCDREEASAAASSPATDVPLSFSLHSSEETPQAPSYSSSFSPFSSPASCPFSSSAAPAALSELPACSSQSGAEHAFPAEWLKGERGVKSLRRPQLLAGDAALEASAGVRGGGERAESVRNEHAASEGEGPREGDRLPESVLRAAAAPSRPVAASQPATLLTSIAARNDAELQRDEAFLSKALSLLPQGLGLGDKESSVLLDVLVALGLEREEERGEAGAGESRRAAAPGARRERAKKGKGGLGDRGVGEEERVQEGDNNHHGEKGPRADESAALEGEGKPRRDAAAAGLSPSLHDIMSSSLASSSLSASSAASPPPGAFSLSAPGAGSSAYYGGVPFPVTVQPPGLELNRSDASLVWRSDSLVSPYLPYASLFPGGTSAAASWDAAGLSASPRQDARRDAAGAAASPGVLLNEDDISSLLEHLLATTERQRRDATPQQSDAALLERLLLDRDSPFAPHAPPSPHVSRAAAHAAPLPEVARCSGAPGAKGGASFEGSSAARHHSDLSFLLSPGGEFEKTRLLQQAAAQDIASLLQANALLAPLRSPGACGQRAQRASLLGTQCHLSSLFPRRLASHPTPASHVNSVASCDEGSLEGARGAAQVAGDNRGGGSPLPGVPGASVSSSLLASSVASGPSALNFLCSEASAQARAGARGARGVATGVVSAPSPTAVSVAGVGAESRRGKKKREGRRGRGLAAAVENLDAATAPLPPSCSAALRSFRLGTLQPFTLRDVGDNALEFSKDPFGSAFLQEQLEVCSLGERVPILLQLLPHVLDLTADQHGNYVLQKFLEKGTDKEKEWLAAQLVGHVFRLSLEVYGCRVIQRALEFLAVPAQLRLVAELKDHVVTCVEDQHGNHVIQKCAERLPSPSVQFIIDAFKGQEARMSVHSYGCRVIQRLLEACPVSQTAPLIDAVIAELRMLIRDQFGNYVVQHILEFGRESDKMKIIDLMCEDIIPLSTEKYACNVVERALTLDAMGRARRGIISAALGHEMVGQPLKRMMLDRYGNYVVQRMMEVAPDDLRPSLLQLLREHVDVLKRFTYGKHIVTALERLDGASGVSGDPSANPSPSSPLPSYAAGAAGSSKSGARGDAASLRASRQSPRVTRSVSATLVHAPGPVAQLFSSVSFSGAPMPHARGGNLRGAGLSGRSGGAAASAAQSGTPSALPAHAPLAAGGGGAYAAQGRSEGPSDATEARDAGRRFGSGQAKQGSSENGARGGRGEREEKLCDRARQEKSAAGDEAGASEPSLGAGDARGGKAAAAKAGKEVESGGAGKGRRAERGRGGEESFGRMVAQLERRGGAGPGLEKSGRRLDAADKLLHRGHTFAAGSSAADAMRVALREDVPRARERSGGMASKAKRDEDAQSSQTALSQASALAALQRYFLASLSPSGAPLDSSSMLSSLPADSTFEASRTQPHHSTFAALASSSFGPSASAGPQFPNCRAPQGASAQASGSHVSQRVATFSNDGSSVAVGAAADGSVRGAGSSGAVGPCRRNQRTPSASFSRSGVPFGVPREEGAAGAPAWRRDGEASEAGSEDAGSARSSAAGALAAEAIREDKAAGRESDGGVGRCSGAGSMLPLTPEMMNEVLKVFHHYRQQTQSPEDPFAAWGLSERGGWDAGDGEAPAGAPPS
ncbi:Pumilio-family RNA binding repeat-containing protein [Besnoitia besnoiti]|uniref:Pumilio-family RNA binding repeat-containing protein n=1 Tax=Besnoitia besnoiti TaxID=94643 RepID=A0A2A9MGL3_BESBE|nr:Pumilio-family RNA binding repeat-containing protein [Besnoitia besnoiti]PFH36304.1 Pumilio-family RNA binding repeat-containing protein [Besnoitia besnoiti]